MGRWKAAWVRVLTIHQHVSRNLLLALAEAFEDLHVLKAAHLAKRQNREAQGPVGQMRLELVARVVKDIEFGRPALEEFDIIKRIAHTQPVKNLPLPLPTAPVPSPFPLPSQIST